MTLGLARLGTRESPWEATRFTGGLRGDVLFLRERDLDWGVGPYVELATFDSFHDAQVGGGASVLAPVHPYLPIVLSAGAYERHADPWGWEPGVAASLFWGTRGFNYHAPYSLTAGLLLQARRGLGDSHETAFSAGAQLDLAFLALPLVYAYEAVTH